MDNYDFDIFEPKIGEVVPEDLAFEVFHEGKISPKTFADFRGSWTVLLFYPADFTFVCPTALEDRQALYASSRPQSLPHHTPATSALQTSTTAATHSPPLLTLLVRFNLKIEKCHGNPWHFSCAGDFFQN